jgi:hypothetical protein
MDDHNASIPVERIEKSIFLIRGHKILLDSDLADLYDVETKYLIQAVKRNIERFPPDFMFQLTQDELASLRSQIVTSKGRGGRRYLPYVFTEQGVAMFTPLNSLIYSTGAKTIYLGSASRSRNPKLGMVKKVIRNSKSEPLPRSPR